MSVDRSKLEIAEHPPAWVSPIDLHQMDGAVLDIMRFFVVNSPCAGVSALGLPLSHYGWIDDVPKNNGYLHKRLLEEASLTEGETLFVGKRREHMKEVFRTASMTKTFYNEWAENRVAYLAAGNALLALFATIRNAFAHLRFNLIDSSNGAILVMENGVATKNEFEVKARIVLKVDTLISWINIVENESEIEIRLAAQRAVEEREKAEELIRMATAAIRNGQIKSQNDLREALSITKSEVKRLISTMKDRGIAEYSRAERRWVSFA